MNLALEYVFKGNHPVTGPIYFPRISFLKAGDSDRYQRFLANTLDFLASTVDDCNEILADIEKVESGELTDFEIDGLDTEAVVSKNEVQINITLDDDWIDQPEGRFSLREFKAAMLAYRDFLLLPKSPDSVISAEI